MYAANAKLISIASQTFNLPISLVAKLQGNIVFDLIISFIPLIGTFFTWINASSTRNAALIHTYIVEVELKRINEAKPTNPNNVQTRDLNYSGKLPNQL